MKFTRSSAGIKNYPKFYGKSLVFYIEGKQASLAKTRDEIFYESLLTEVLGHNSFKIKVVGNKKDVLDYWEKLRKEQSKDGVAVVDKDLDGISTSTLKVRNLIYTLGYSWENDFWRDEILQEVIGNLTLSNPAAAKEIIGRKTLMARRLSKIAALDIGAQLNETALIKKNGKSCGIGFDDRHRSLVPKSEFKRIKQDFEAKGLKACSITWNLVSAAIKAPSENSIQGHLWENACVHLICSIYKKYTGAKAAPHELILNVATSIFKSSPQICVSASVKTHFKTSINLALQ